jgi:hypothetical protein
VGQDNSRIGSDFDDRHRLVPRSVVVPCEVKCLVGPRSIFWRGARSAMLADVAAPEDNRLDTSARSCRDRRPDPVLCRAVDVLRLVGRVSWRPLSVA